MGSSNFSIARFFDWRLNIAPFAMKFAELQPRSIISRYFDFGSSQKPQLFICQHWRGEEIQRCTLLSIQDGAGCSEGDCAYCAQSAHYLPPASSAKDLLVARKAC